MNLHSYSQIFSMEHKATIPLRSAKVIIEEKVDGSQITFGMIGGALCIRSKGQEIHIGAVPNIFGPSVLTIEKLFAEGKLVEGLHYRGEAISKPRHNVLAYARVPIGNIALYDIDDGQCNFLSRQEKEEAALKLGLEVVPLLFEGVLEPGQDLEAFVSKESFLGGQQVEGIVVKPALYDLYSQDKKVVMGKLVRESFKEIHRGAWKASNPGPKDILTELGNQYRTPARWDKALIHLKERSQIEGKAKDIGPLIKEVRDDVERECREDIKDALWAWAWPHVGRKLHAGLPEWYNSLLWAEGQEALNGQIEEEKEAA